MIHRAAARDERSLASLYDATSSIVYGLSLRILGNAVAAEENVVEAFSGIWDGRFRFDPSIGSPIFWIIAVTRACALECLRSARNVIPIPITSALGAPGTDSSGGCHGEASLSEEAGLARSALDALAPEVRKALELAYFEGLSAEEIAARLFVSADTIRTRIRQGMGQLREQFHCGLRLESSNGRN